MKREKYQVIKFNGEDDDCLMNFDNIDDAIAAAKCIARSKKMKPSQTHHPDVIVQYCKMEGSRIVDGIGVIRTVETE